MRIGVGVCCWIENDSQLPELKRCLDSLVDFYPVIVINGKWYDIEGKNAYSTNEACNLIDSYSNVIRIDYANKPEFMARNQYLIQAMKMELDYLFWIDTDEYIELPLGIEFFERGIDYVFNNSNLKSCMFHEVDQRCGGNGMSIKCIRYPGFTRHKIRHNQWFFGNEDTRNNHAGAARGIIVHHDKQFRSQNREDRMKERNVLNPVH